MPKVLALLDGAIVEIEAGGGGGGAPTFVDPNAVFAVAKNQQVLFTEPIDMALGAEIVFEENAVLVEVT